MPIVSKSLHYRQCRWAHSGSQLYTVLSTALNGRKVGRRVQFLGDPNADHPACRLVNIHAAFGTGVAGSVIEWTKDQGRPFIPEGDDMDQLDVELMPADKRRFVEGMAFFFVRGNHAIIAPSKALGTSKVISHWEWLIEQARAVPDNQSFHLAEVAPDRRQLESLLQGVRSVQFSLQPELQDGASTQIARESATFSASRGLLKRIMAWVEETGGDGIEPARMVQALASPHIRATVNIAYDGRMPDGGAPMLDTLARFVSEIDEAAFKIAVPNHGDLTDDQLRLRQVVRVQATEGQPNRGELWTYMSDWLEGLIQGGTVRENV